MAARSKKAKSRRASAKPSLKAKGKQPSKKRKPTRRPAQKPAPIRRSPPKKKPKPLRRTPKPAPIRRKGPSKKTRREAAIKGWQTRRVNIRRREESVGQASPLLIDAMIKLGGTVERTADGIVIELRKPAGRGLDEIADRWLSLQEALSSAIIDQASRGNVWIQAGLRFRPGTGDDASHYDRIDGMRQEWLYPGRIDRWREHFTGAYVFTERMLDNGRTIVQIAFRITVGRRPDSESGWDR